MTCGCSSGCFWVKVIGGIRQPARATANFTYRDGSPAPSVSLVCRREVWLPTLWGWLVLLALLALVAVIVGRALHPFLAINEPSGGKILVVEGWMEPYNLDQAVAVFRNGSYELAVVTGPTFAEWPQGNFYRT